MHYKLYIKGHIIKFLEKITQACPAKASFFSKSLSLIRDKSGLEAMLQKNLHIPFSRQTKLHCPKRMNHKFVLF